MLDAIRQFCESSNLVTLSPALNVVLAVALLFKSALNEIVIDWHRRYQERRERRRKLLLELYEHMIAFDTRYVLLAAITVLDEASTGWTPFVPLKCRPSARSWREYFLHPFKQAWTFSIGTSSTCPPRFGRASPCCTRR